MDDGCCGLLVVYCLLIAGCWLLVVGCWLLVVGCWRSSLLFVVRCCFGCVVDWLRSCVVCYALVFVCCLFVVCCLLCFFLVVCCLLCVVCYVLFVDRVLSLCACRMTRRCFVFLARFARW